MLCAPDNPKEVSRLSEPAKIGENGFPLFIERDPIWLAPLPDDVTDIDFWDRGGDDLLGSPVNNERILKLNEREAVVYTDDFPTGNLFPRCYEEDDLLDSSDDNERIFELNEREAVVCADDVPTGSNLFPPWYEEDDLLGSPDDNEQGLYLETTDAPGGISRVSARKNRFLYQARSGFVSKGWCLTRQRRRNLASPNFILAQPPTM